LLLLREDVAGGKDIPNCCAKSPAKIQLFFVLLFFHRTPRHLCDGGYRLLSVSFSAKADWCRCVAASQPRYPTSHRRITNPTEYTSIQPVQASNPSSIHPSMTRSITTHGTCPGFFTFSPLFSPWLFILSSLFLSAYLLLSGVLYEPR
jgi:hypothetical protein